MSVEWIWTSVEGVNTLNIETMSPLNGGWTSKAGS